MASDRFVAGCVPSGDIDGAQAAGDEKRYPGLGGRQVEQRHQRFRLQPHVLVRILDQGDGAGM